MIDESGLTSILEREGTLGPEGLAAARERQRNVGGELTRHLLDVGAVDESSLLRAISILHQTRYITTETLAKAKFDLRLAQIVPEELASAYRLCPLKHEAASGTLRVVAATPTPDLVEKMQALPGVETAVVYVALGDAVDAAIRKLYHGDDSGFAREADVLDTPTLENQLDQQTTRKSALDDDDISDYDENVVTGEITALRQRHLPGGGAQGTLPPLPHEVGQPSWHEPPSVSVSYDSYSIGGGGGGGTADGETVDLRHRPEMGSAGWNVAAESFVETVKVLVSVAEMTSGTWRKGHAAEVARESLRLGMRIGLDEYDLAMLEVAAYLHDLGKPDDPHLTLLGIGKVPDQKALAERVWDTPLKLLENAKLPVEITECLGSVYERVDGHGLPQQKRGRDIPTIARVLALVDAYVELTTNPFGAAGGKIKTQTKAMEVLRQHGGTYFDNNLVEILDQTTSGDDLRARLLGERPRVLIADPDAEATAVLELKFVAGGFEVRVARTSAEVEPVVQKWLPDLLVCEVGLKPEGGFAVLERIRKDPATRELPVYFVAAQAPSADVERGFALGAIDYLKKPVTPEVLITKAKRTLAEVARTARAEQERKVIGSLAEMSVGDVVEVLGKGKKSGALRLRRGVVEGDVFLDGGLIVHAIAGEMTGQEAFWRLLRVKEGEFIFEAAAAPPERSIDAPTEWLLLEGMRRLDETT